MIYQGTIFWGLDALLLNPNCTSWSTNFRAPMFFPANFVRINLDGALPLEAKICLRSACAFEDVSLLQVKHDPMVPLLTDQGENPPKKCHFQWKFCILTSLAIIWLDLWLTMVFSKEGMQRNFSFSTSGVRKSRNLCSRFSMLVDGFLIYLCLVWRLENPYSNLSMFLYERNLWWPLILLNSDPSTLCLRCSFQDMDTLWLCGHLLLLKYGELSTNVSRPNHIRILKMPHSTYSKSRILLKLLTLFLEGFHDSLYSKNMVDKV